MRLGCLDHDFVAVAQPRIDGHVAAVDEGGDGLVADVGVHGVGEIERRRATRQGDQAALGREAEHLIVEQFELGVLEKLFRVFRLQQRVDHHAQTPIRRHVVGLRAAPLVDIAVVARPRALLVEGVRGDAELGDAMHLVRADLQFDTLVARAVHRRVDRLVIVALGRRDVVLEAPGHRAPGGVHDAEHTVAVVDRVDHHAEREDVGQLFEADLLVLHLAPDGIGLLLAPRGLRLDAGIRELARERLTNFLDQPFVARAQFIELLASPLGRLPDAASGMRGPPVPRAATACP